MHPSLIPDLPPSWPPSVYLRLKFDLAAFQEILLMIRVLCELVTLLFPLDGVPKLVWCPAVWWHYHEISIAEFKEKMY